MRIPPGCTARKAFTLVELVTAASLMTVMMVGVVEIFGIVATTAGEAEGVHFAHQQMRAFFDRLNADVRGMTREGYLAIQKGMIVPSGSTNYLYREDSADGPNNGYPERYGADTLAFVTLGSCRNQMDGTPNESNAAEVVYTNYIMTDAQQILQVDGTDVGPRRGVLGRGLWLLGGTGTSGPWSGQSGQYLTQLFVDENETIQAMQNQGAITTPPVPEILQSGGAADGAIHVDPWLTARATTVGANPDSLNRVMACCVSEFYVEAFTPILDMGTTYWHGDDDAARTYRWSDVYESGGTALEYPTGEKIETWPMAIRVTVAVHDPGDAGEIPEGADRYQGFALQETFWLGDP